MSWVGRGLIISIIFILGLAACGTADPAPVDVVEPETEVQEAAVEEASREEAEADEASVAEVRRRVAHRRGEMLEQIADIADHLEAATDDGRCKLRLLINSVKYYDKLLTELRSS